MESKNKKKYPDVSETQRFPRVLIVSSTIISDATATGSLVKNLFTGWPKSSLAQIYISDHGKKDYTVCDKYFRFKENRNSIEELFDEVEKFNPHVIYYRTHDNPLAFHGVIRNLLDRSTAKLVTHFMDDWPEKVRKFDAENYMKFRNDIDYIFKRSRYNYVISESMAAAYHKLYKVNFKVLHNFVDPDDWSEIRKNVCNEAFIVRYCGSLADDMQRQSINEISQIIGELQKTVDIRLEVYVNDAFMNNAKLIRKYPGCTVHKQVLRKDYINLLCDADLLVIASNFDTRSISYTRYSLANKLPEYMASGTPILAYGSLEVETIAYCKRTDAINMVTEHDLDKLKSKILEIYFDKDAAITKAARAKKYAEKFMNVRDKRDTFHSLLSGLAEANSSNGVNRQGNMLIGEYQRGSKIDFQEHKLIEKYIGHDNKLMINVGAHFGGSISGFIKKGWHVIAFEPDKKNRAVLEKRFSGESNIQIIADAVSDSVREKSAFFTSKQSTGISTLNPFDESHSHTDYVNITTLEKYCDEKEIKSVGFLLIDAEGYDLQVLRGFPWSRMLPEYIVCEFEDKKSTKLNYTSYDLAEFLREKGYSILLSEWYPVKQYGVSHDWRCLKHYPCQLEDNDAWGNIIAFRNEPDWSKIYTIAGSLSVPKKPADFRDVLKKLRTRFWM